MVFRQNWKTSIMVNATSLKTRPTVLNFSLRKLASEYQQHDCLSV
jgi:hypothetical protein